MTVQLKSLQAHGQTAAYAMMQVQRAAECEHNSGVPAAKPVLGSQAAEVICTCGSWQFKLSQARRIQIV